MVLCGPGAILRDFLTTIPSVNLASKHSFKNGNSQPVSCFVLRFLSAFLFFKAQYKRVRNVFIKKSL